MVLPNTAQLGTSTAKEWPPDSVWGPKFAVINLMFSIGKVNIKLMKKYKVKLTKKFNIDFPITGSLKPVIGFYFIFYFQFPLIYLLVCMMALLFL